MLPFDWQSSEVSVEPLKPTTNIMKCHICQAFGSTTHDQYSFILVVDDIRIKFVNRKDVEHLFNALEDYKVETGWTGGLYCGITLDLNYKDIYVDLAAVAAFILSLSIQKLKSDFFKVDK